MGKIVILTGSPRRKGNTFAMVNAFKEAAAQQGHTITQFDTAFMKVAGCRGCDKCYAKGTACIYKHEFNKVVDTILEADFILIASPVYWYTFPAQIKAVIDHFYAFCVGGKDFKGKQCALIACCAETSLETFDGIRFAFKKTMEYLKCQIVDEILIPDVTAPGDIKQTDGEKRAAELALSLQF
ncbi:MAG: flavodoxin family protein [Oxalobacter sp.]|jgi:multimeric flavodoxin WrbA|nr:flavodoxin family protein [Oxalobacter sp.]